MSALGAGVRPLIFQYLKAAVPREVPRQGLGEVSSSLPDRQTIHCMYLSGVHAQDQLLAIHRFGPPCNYLLELKGHIKPP